jgi:hypothetical protein
MHAQHTLPSDGYDALAHDARRIHCGDLSDATTTSYLVGNLLLNTHVIFLFVIYLDECTSICANNLMRSKGFNYFSRFSIPDKSAWRALATANFTAQPACLIKGGLGMGRERESGCQQHERRRVGSEAGAMAAWMLICTCIFCIEPQRGNRVKRDIQFFRRPESLSVRLTAFKSPCIIEIVDLPGSVLA